MENPRFKVIIVGGSVAGLTLAHCLDQANIEYLVLEKHANIQTNIGGSIVLMPNGCRILDQLGVYSLVEKSASPIRVAHTGYPDGYGFPVTILTRFQLLNALYAAFKDSSKIRTGCKVVKVELNDKCVSVWTDDGQEYQGHIVVGADGVHSTVRSEIWRISDDKQPGWITEDEKHGMHAEYRCIFGISQPVVGINPGEQIIRCFKNLSFLVFPGKDGCIGWFAIQKLDRKYIYPTAPRLSHDEVREKAENLVDFPIWKGVRFGDIWMRTTGYSSTSLEENLFRTWHYGRAICVGDSISKLAPNIAQGANMAIENVAALANVLHRISALEEPSDCIINGLLRNLATGLFPRFENMHRVARSVVRFHSQQGWIKPLLGRYLYPLSGDLLFYSISSLLADATAVDYIPLPNRSKGKWESAINKKKVLCQLALLVVMLIFCHHFTRGRIPPLA
ncbi:hypothetical protein LOZ53_004500 [Ophidiomyces ophidiicola]|nr:hypothetical protein LOZ55_002312 [Ophidiomyces ophidiicola]KAI1986927.1 hypothetical protein LOZ53_004500 [Ophidiomyces ophidiicola]KAI1987414.1 hypothetical protein LOZ54_003586 [Ophidiomyces ophidiicola]KAI2001192.1 hypothetical protein LOZ51_001484 [Ophidiomyces ophidiicola]